MRTKFLKFAEDAERSGNDTEAHSRALSDGEAHALLRSANEKLVLAMLRAEAHAEEAKGLHLLLDSVEGYAIYLLDCAGNVATWNAGAERVLGHTKDEVVGRHIAIFHSAEERSSGKIDRALRAAERDGRIEDEGFCVRRDGSRFWANIVLTALRDRSGKLVGYGSVTRDLTERVRMDLEREERVRAEEAARRKDEFLAIMGHELRNPLAPMVSALHLLKQRSDSSSERELAVLDRQVHHMMRLVDDLLDVTRLLRDGLPLSKRVVEIAELVQSSVDVASPRIVAKGQRLEIDVPARGLLVDVDPARIVQVIGNLLTNAAKFTNEGGAIHVRSFIEGRHVRIDVEDTGIGIAPELVSRVFELFTQGVQGIERHLGGLGVGLAVAQRLVEMHGGQIEVNSEGHGLGSRFTLRLPKAENVPASAERVEPVLSPPSASPKRVLVVDDNVDSNDMMAAVLEQLGHDVRTAVDGPNALECIVAFEPDVVFLDIGLPGMSGLEVARRTRQLPGCTAIPIVAVSGYAAEADRKEAFAAGFSDHIAKPILPGRIEAVVGSAEIRARRA